MSPAAFPFGLVLCGLAAPFLGKVALEPFTEEADPFEVVLDGVPVVDDLLGGSTILLPPLVASPARSRPLVASPIRSVVFAAVFAALLPAATPVLTTFPPGTAARGSSARFTGSVTASFACCPISFANVPAPCLPGRRAPIVEVGPES